MKKTTRIERALQELGWLRDCQAATLENYHQVVLSTPDAGLHFLLGLIQHEQQRNQHYVSTMLSSVSRSVYWLPFPNDVPDILVSGARSSVVVEDIEVLRELARERGAHLRVLKRELKGTYGGKLELLVDLLLTDVKKHLRVLTYVQKSLLHARRDRPGESQPETLKAAVA